jgi:hypothetical protein
LDSDGYRERLIVAQILPSHNQEDDQKKGPAERRARVKGCHDAKIIGGKKRRNAPKKY